MATTTYTVAVGENWPELVAWGPTGVEDGPSPLANHGRVHFITEADAAPVEYAPRGTRPFSGADLVLAEDSWWRFADATDDRLTYVDGVTGVEVVLCYEPVPDTDVLLRWVELTNRGDAPLSVERFGSAGFCVPTNGARLTFLSGQWAQEFQRQTVNLPAGRFRIGSRYGVPGHNYAPWLAVQDATGGQAWGLSLAWPGSWEIDAEVDPTGMTRVRAGRLPHPGPLVVDPGATLTSPKAALAYSAEGLDGLARVWHAYERVITRQRTRPVLYNSWEATGFDVDAAGQLALAKVAADVGAELFVVDDGWFTGRHDDTGGLGDWTPDESAFPGGFGGFVDDVRALGLDFGLWVEPESVSPKSRLYAEHPDWVYRVDGRPLTLIRNQLLLNLGREDVLEFVWSMLDRLLSSHPISYLKWDMNRPATPRGPGVSDLDGAHVRNYLEVLTRLRAAHPDVLVEACAGGGGRTDLATIALSDVVWPSDNTAPLDRLSVQDGFLLAHAPHLMSSWVTDAPGIFDARPRSLRFRFVLAMAGVLGIGADVSRWTAAQRDEARDLVARYKEIREVVHTGEVHRLPDAVQYVTPETTVVLAWNTGALPGIPEVPGRPVRLPLTGLSTGSHVDRESGARYSAAHLTHVGLPVHWTRDHDADVVVLDHVAT
ncbi:alpha-galactosidase [Actinophytocola algeriensis]|uniref:alpha-galactosidase n=1 Tax=Actinophytocola algeriensis TaxID=1768010 RepID=A0A7W7VC45_9PSEU|nr:alpha-galactosidase [Actinophytocola algeriensis]MBB4904709.1 alpha-galactosidase [Actinophytocola algeriensis]MBE1476432.1 alpha-galactosidase [Actinophytocola algeriensis]